MAGKTDFNPTEWELLKQAPLMASMLIAASHPSGPVGLIKESAAAAKMMIGAAATAQTPLLKSLTEDLKQNMSLPTQPPSGKGADAMKQNALDKLKDVAGLLSSKASPAEADEVKGWLANVAKATAEASMEGGFLGFGGVQVSDTEKAALAELDTVLGTKAAATA